MTRIRRNLIAAAAVAAVIYLFGAFVMADIDFRSWSEGVRAAVVVIATSYAVLVVMYLESNA